MSCAEAGERPVACRTRGTSSGAQEAEVTPPGEGQWGNLESWVLLTWALPPGSEFDAFISVCEVA